MSEKYVNSGELISALCLVTPDGCAHWFESNKGRVYVEQVISAWKEQNPEYENTMCTMGVIEIRMPKERFNKIPANNEFDWPELQVIKESVE